MTYRRATRQETKDWLGGGLVMPGPKRPASSEEPSDLQQDAEHSDLVVTGEDQHLPPTPSSPTCRALSARRRLDAPPGDRSTTMSAAEAQKLVAEVLEVRRSHPHAPALAALDLVMKGRGQLPDIDDIAPPPAPFALVVAEAFDRCFAKDEWARWTIPPADPALSAAMQVVWAAEVWPKFVQRYGLV